MKKQVLLNSGLKLLIFCVVAIFISCGQTKKKQEDKAIEVVKDEQPSCEVEMSASVLKNSLLAPSENLKFAAIKLHELSESHNHERISEQAQSITDESIKLMKASAHLTSHHLDSLLFYSTSTAVLANSLHASNKSLGKAKLKMIVSKLESLSESVGSYTSRNIIIDRDVCLTNKEMLGNEIRLYYTTLRSGIKSIESSLGSHCENCIANEVSFYENLMKTFRETLIKAPTNQYKTVSRTLADLDHSFNELTNLHDEEDVHHTLETINRQMARFKDELMDMTGILDI